MSRDFLFLSVNKFPRQTIETERLLLMPYQQKYTGEYFTLIQKNKNRLKDSFPTILRSTTSEPDTHHFIQQKIVDWNKNKAYAFLLFYKENRQLIGHLNLKALDWKKRQAEIAYFIDEDFVCRGLTSEAILRVMQIVFNQLEFQRLFAKVIPSNKASVSVLEKCGLRYEGAFFSDFTTYDHQQTDTNCYGITRDVFLRQKNNFNPPSKTHR